MQLKRFGVILLIAALILSVCPAGAAAQSAPQKDVRVLSEQVAAPAGINAAAPTAIQADQYFTDPGTEVVSADKKKGLWLYRSSTLYVNVTRKFNKKKVQTYFVADIRFQGTEKERVGFANPKHPGYGTSALYKIARKNRAVIAVSGDFMQQGKSSKKGLIVRNGKVYNAIKGKQSRAKTLSFYPNGTMHINSTNKSLWSKLKAAGVKNTFSFGPALIEKGVVNKKLKKHRLYSNHPRCAVGMVGPGHYIFIVVDGRQRSYSRGMTLTELANVFKSYNCTLAYCLDGGATASMCFMGVNINNKGSISKQRPVTDALMFGYSTKVPKK
jgi:exopolysaccharide biosynthesis protein